MLQSYKVGDVTPRYHREISATMDVLVWTFLLVCFSIQDTFGLNYFPIKLKTGTQSESVSLTCNTTTDQPLTWKYKNNSLTGQNQYRINGKNLELMKLDRTMVGEYSCWDEDQILDRTHVLIQIEEDEEPQQELIRCRAQTYGCTLTCYWTDREFTAVRLRFDCAQEEACPWILRTKDQGFEFLLSHSHSIYAEEAPLLVRAEAIDKEYYLKTSKRFYLRDVVIPDSPQRVTCKVQENNLQVTVEPPLTWAKPLSYFPLEHEIEYVYKDDGKRGYSLNLHLPLGISKLRVRSRDPLVQSAWSDWTSWFTPGGEEGGAQTRQRGRTGRRSGKEDEGRKMSALR